MEIYFARDKKISAIGLEGIPRAINEFDEIVNCSKEKDKAILHKDAQHHWKPSGNGFIGIIEGDALNFKVDDKGPVDAIWDRAALIALSPGANFLRFKKDYHVVDDIKDEFYGYSILKASGEFLDSNFSSLLRDKNSFGIEITNTDDGLYHASLPLVQKEHVVLLDNKTVFNDTIYNPSTGYRQERIRVNGYRSDNWNGGLNIPGFIFDDASTAIGKNGKTIQLAIL